MNDWGNVKPTLNELVEICHKTHNVQQLLYQISIPNVLSAPYRLSKYAHHSHYESTTDEIVVQFQSMSMTTSL